ncbi:semaphorin-3C isoform X1 [Pelmatolapia mariae]|uniref:semaphorin-3C isoform X1 n=1 Tax=Pelmatolapia mariae TaxID=158779 RepID=UPI002FE599FF
MGRPEGLARPPLVSAMAFSLLVLSFLCTRVSSLPQPLPRVFLSFEDLQASESFEHYSISDKAMDYRLLQMDEDQDRMYVGCKDHVLSMDINNITHGTLKLFWPASTSKIEECQMAGKDPTHGCGNFIRVVQPYNRTHLFMCGSGAYSPVCVYVNRGRRPEEQVFHIDSRTESGKGRCSFNPQVNTVSVMLNQELFSGMYIDFMGTDAAIFRSLTKRNAVRTDQHNSKWLSEPIFIDSHLIPDGTDPNDSKLYFFFRERLTDNNGNTKNIHTMVARVCPVSPFCFRQNKPAPFLLCFCVAMCGFCRQNDIGGQRSLVNKWTTFLKARMVCSVVEEDGTETHFDELESVFLLETDLPKGLLVFGVFTSTSSVFKGSAVCVYNMADILTVFNGPFAHREGPNFQWIAFQGRIPYPRPGTCPGGAFTPDIQTTKEFPDDVVTFVRNHPVMFNAIYPVGRRPLVVRTNADYKYTAVAVDQVMAADGNYQVLFLGTDKGTIQKVIVLPSNHSLHDDLILEELEVFKNKAPVTNLRISSKKQQLYASSEFGVSQVSLHRCQAYGSACADCCLARDPYCAWDGLSCSRFYPTGKRRSRRQDIMHGNPLTQCRGFNLKAYRNAVEMTQYGVKNNTTFLECLPKSPQASIRWLIQRDNDRRKEVKLSDRVLSTEHGLLIRSVQLSDQGLYYCLTTENGFKRTVAKIRLRVLSEAMVSMLTDKQQSPWAWASSLHPKVLLAAFSPAENLAVQQYCKERKELKNLQQRQQQQPSEPPGPLRGDLAKLKPLLDRRKSRNRRNHPED